MMRRQYELMQVENNEKIADFFNRIITHTNVMKNCDEKISNQTIVERSTESQFQGKDHAREQDHHKWNKHLQSQEKNKQNMRTTLPNMQRL